MIELPLLWLQRRRLEKLLGGISNTLDELCEAVDRLALQVDKSVLATSLLLRWRLFEILAGLLGGYVRVGLGLLVMLRLFAYGPSLRANIFLCQVLSIF